MFTMIDNLRVRSCPAGDLAWWFGLLAALGGLVLCLGSPWASDVLLGGGTGTGRRPPANANANANATGSVEAFAANGALGGGRPADALHAAVAVRDVWAVALVIGLVVALVRLGRGPRTNPRRMTVLRLLAAVPLVVAPVAAALIAVLAVRAVGVHALPGFVAVPVTLFSGALVSAIWLMPRPAGATWRVVAATMVFVLVATAGTVSFARWYTGPHLISGTTSDRPAAAHGPGPTRPGSVAWRMTSPRPGPAVWQRAGYTVITHYVDDPKGDRGGEVHVYDSATGRERWHYRRGDAVLRVANLTDDTLDLQAIDLTGRGSLTGFDLASGRRRWHRTERNLWMHPAPARLAGGSLLYSMVSAMPSDERKFIGLQSPSRGGAVSLVDPDCTFVDAAASSSTLVVGCQTFLNKSFFHGFRAGQPLWSLEAPSNADERMQLGNTVLAIPGPPGTPGWIFYRMSDALRLWRDHGTERLFLTGDRVLEQTARGELSVRDASTGRTLWSADARRLHLRPGGELDGVVAADGALYATWRYDLEHVSLITFDERSGSARGTTDLRSVIGDRCQGNDCAMLRLDAAGGGVVLITATHRVREGQPQDVVYALADGTGFTEPRR
jgi:putative pyrroloquinoline-quinone binding quinoprotein